MHYTLYKKFKKPANSEDIYIFFHGFGSSSCISEFDATTPHITTLLQASHKGCGILTFDFTGHGQSKSDTNITPAKEISDIKEIFTLVTSNYPQSKIIPICASHGALMLSIFLDQNPIFVKNIKKIIAWYPCLQYENIFYTKQSNKIIPLIPGSQELSTKMQSDFEQGLHIFNPWGDLIITSDFYKDIEKYSSSFLETTTIPTLILHGNKDNVVPISYSKHLAQNNKNIILKTINNASHSFEETAHKKEVIQQSLAFLKKEF